MFAGLMAVIASVMFYHLHDQFFAWEKFNPNGINTLIFLALCALGILSLVKELDQKPLLEMNQKGISVRTTILPFSP